ncbi:MAG: GIY-YIG nuclease family protein [Candidatus Niameybacter stercoravium]|nr:GIY-YIG nuclease family protein [Candidatus Niameybacter stercoravium]
MYFIYIVKCRDETYYTGYTTDIERRLKAHNEGKGAKYTRCRLPVELVYWEQYEEKSQALKREYAIKQLTRKQKQQLIGRSVHAEEEHALF